MNRNLMVLVGALLWMALGLELFRRYAIGDGMALIVVGVGWLVCMTVWVARRSTALVHVRPHE